ncbi:MAG: tripartite tricarboxylate transporter substrate binding protein [Rhodospirillales bacterium]
MLRKTFIAAAAMAAFAGFGATTQAADLSCGTAKLIVPWGAGGGTDVIFRIFAEEVNKDGMSPQLQVVNVPGQGGNKGAKDARKAKADGCTLFAIHQSAITSFFTGRVDFSWDAFEPISLLTRTPAIIGASKSVPYDDIAGLVKAAKAAPGEILAGGTLGSTSHFVFLLLEDATGTKFKHISYDGTRERMTALMADNIQLGEINLAAAKKAIQTGELKALGITTEERNPEIPDTKTLKEQGYDLVYGTDRGVMAPKGTPADVLTMWGDRFVKACKSESIKKQMEAKGSLTFCSTPAEYTKYWQDTFAKWEKLAIEVGMYQK